VRRLYKSFGVKGLIGLQHSTAIAQITRSSVKLHTSCNEGGWFCALWNRVFSPLLIYLVVPANVCMFSDIKVNVPYVCWAYFIFTVGDSYVLEQRRQMRCRLYPDVCDFYRPQSRTSIRSLLYNQPAPLVRY
jgi:hypothetical protein